MNVELSGKAKKKSFIQKIKTRFFHALRIYNGPIVKLYNGYGNKTQCFLYGHALSLGPLPRKKYRKFFLLNTLALLRLFMVRTVKNASLQFTWEGKKYFTRSEADGFFKFEWQPSAVPGPGIYKVQVDMIDDISGDIKATGSATLIIPYYNQYAFISDIDDTFLVSHSSNLRKRLFVLLTENARSRKPFEGVVNHYQLLSTAHAPADTSNPFFYVSSSEWNLYDYINEFSAGNKLPQGVYLLNQIKKFSQVFKTGQNNHKTKFMRITRILEAYPQLNFILLGDDSQEDPFIYASVVAHFKDRIVCIYIRQVGKKPKLLVEEKLKEMAAPVSYCYFIHSAEAVIHSREIGLLAHV